MRYRGSVGYVTARGALGQLLCTPSAYSVITSVTPACRGRWQENRQAGRHNPAGAPNPPPEFCHRAVHARVTAVLAERAQ